MKNYPACKELVDFLVFSRLDEDGKVLTPEEILYRVSRVILYRKLKSCNSI